MSDRNERELLRYLEGGGSPEERAGLERRLEASSALRSELERARRGLEGMRALRSVVRPPERLADAVLARVDGERPSPAASRFPGLRRAATIAALLLLPVAGWVARDLAVEPAVPPGTGAGLPAATPRPVVPGNQYMILFRGVWPDLGELTPQEREARRADYMAWIDGLLAEDRFVTGAELGWDPGLALVANGMGVSAFQPDLAPGEITAGFVVIRAESDEEARQLAEDCPHVRYGGSVIVKRVLGPP